MREPRAGAKRADVIVITKCKKDLTDLEKSEIKSRLKLRQHQKVFFSYIEYSEDVISQGNTKALTSLPKFTLVTGIANARPMVNFLVSKGLEFDHIEYSDHYNFKASDIANLASKSLILTTEKDYVRLSINGSLKDKLFYLPIKMRIDESQLFDATIKSFVS